MSIKLKASSFFIVCLFLSSCIAALQRDSTPTTQPIIITSTLPATVTLSPSGTPTSPIFQSTTAPLTGTTSTQLNVRAEPSTASEVLGIIASNSLIQITGKDVGGSWWQIVYDAGVGGKGWVTAQYVETESGAQVPVIGGGTSNPGLGYMGVAIQQVNIRSGPGTDFNSIGILNVNDVVKLTGKNRNGTWLQIEYGVGPDGTGWIASGFVKADNTDELTIVSDTEDVLGTGTPANTPPPSTPTVAPAPMDFDTADAPLKTVILGGASNYTVLYNGDVSAPAGDSEDWIQITPLSSHILLEITCKGNDLIINLIQNENIFNNVIEYNCGFQKIIPVTPHLPIQIHVRTPVGKLQNYSSYTLKVTTIQ